MNRLAIFDCDGTLVDSQHNICAAMAECFAAHGMPPPPPERTRRVVGLSLVEAMREMRPDADAAAHAAMAEDYKSAFQAMRARGIHLKISANTATTRPWLITALATAAT